MAGTGAPSLQVPDGINIFSAQYARDGDDLLIAAKGSPPLTVTDYFAAGTPAALEAPNGAMLRGDVVEFLAGPRAPAQYAQADAPEGAVAIGQVETLTGSSSATRVSGETVELGLGDPVFQGDVVQTGADSTLGLRLEDGTLASMSAHSRLVLNEFVFEAGESDNWMLVDLVEGAFAFLTGAIAPSGGMEITTPVAVMAIRGTMPVAFVAGEDGASQFFAASDQSYELLHAVTRELLTVITSAAGFSLSSPDAPLETIELDAETLNEIDGLLEVLNQTAAEADLLGIQTDSGFHTYSAFGSIDGNLALLIEFLLLLDGALAEEAVLEVEDPDQFLMAEATLVAQPDQAATDEMSPVTVDVLDNDSHPEDDDLTVVFADVPNGQGTVEIVEGENGQQLVYDPGTAFDYLALGETADVIITYIVADSTGATASSTVTVTLTGINQAPVVAAVADTNLDEQTDTQPLQTTVTVAFTDVDLNNVGHTAAVTGVAVAGDTGKLNLDDLKGLLTPGTVTKNAGENTGLAEFDFSAASTVFDPLSPGEYVTLTYTVEIDDQDGGTSQLTFDIVITGTNDAPVIDVTLSDVAATVVEDGSDADGNPVGQPSASGQIEASDVDNGGTTFSVTPLAGTYGVLTVSATGAWTYVLNEGAADPLALGESDTDVFTVTVTDGFGATDDVEVAITVTGANDAPVIEAETTSASGTVNELEDVTASEHMHEVDGTIAFADVDVSDVHDATVVDDGSDYVGSFSLGEVDQDGKTVAWTFSVVDSDIDHLPEGEKLIQTYTVTISDGQGGTVEHVVTVTMIGANDIPTIIVGDGDSASADLEETDEGLTAEGTLTVSDVSVSDVVTAEVTNVVASGDHNAEIGTSALLDYLTVDSPVLGSSDAQGTLTWTFDSLGEAFDFLAVDEELVLTYTVTLDDGTDTSSFPVTITITGTNDAPVITVVGGDSAAEGLTETDSGLTASGTLSVDDLDISDVVEADVTGVAATGDGDNQLANATLLGFLTVTGTVADGDTAGALTWTFDSGDEAFDFLAKDDKLVLTYTVMVDDGNGGTDSRDVVVTITGTNDAPVIDVALSVVADTVVEDGLDDEQNEVGDPSASGQVEAGDLDQDAVLSYSANTTAGAYGTFAVDAVTGTWTYTLDEAKADPLALGESKSEVFTVTVTDEHGASDEVEVVVTVTGSNDAPETDDVSGLSGYAGSAIEVTLSGSDVDGTVSFFKITTAPTGGGLFLDAEGETPVDPDNIPASGNEATIYFIPDGGVSGDVSFEYAAVDNLGAQDPTPATVDVTVETATIYLMIHQDTWEGGADLPTFDAFQVTIGGITYNLADLNVVDSNFYAPDGDGFTLGVGIGSGGKERYVVFEIEGVPGAASAEFSFDYKITDPQGEAFRDGIRFYAGDTRDGMVLVYDGDEDTAFTGTQKNSEFSSRVLSFNYALAAGATIAIDEVELTAPLDPIILDLGEPGFDLSGTTTFDLTDDGQQNTLAWPGGEDGILVMDIDGSGAIESGNEVFSPFFNGGGFADALEALASLDADGDGVIDAGDEAFADLLVWVDANSDGNSAASELFSLADLGIASINLGAEGVDYQIDGQQILAEGQFTYTDGSTGDYVAVDLDESLSSPDPLASDDEGQSQLFALTDLSIHEVIVDYHDGDVIDLTQLGFALATGETVEEYVQYDSETGELFVDMDGPGGQAQFELVAELTTPLPSVLVRFQDGDAIANVEIA